MEIGTETCVEPNDGLCSRHCVEEIQHPLKEGSTGMDNFTGVVEQAY